MSVKVAIFVIKMTFFRYILIFLLYNTNRFHVAMRLFSNTVPLKGKLTVTRELRNSTRDSIHDPRKFRESSQVLQLASWIFRVSS